MINIKYSETNRSKKLTYYYEIMYLFKKLPNP